MKKPIQMMMIAGMALCLCACSANTNTANTAQETKTESFEQVKEMTVSEIIKRTTPDEINKITSRFSMTQTFENMGEALLDGGSEKCIYALEDGVKKLNDITSYSDGYVKNIYASNDPSDNNYYLSYPGGNEVIEGANEEVNACFSESLSGFSEESTKITSSEEKGGKLILTLESTEEGSTVKSTVTIDQKTGLVTEIVSSYPSVKSSGDTTCTCTFDYSDDVAIDYAAKEAAGDTVETAASSEESTTDGKLTYQTEDINGQAVTEEMVKDAKLVMYNYWEPWCGPCVGEMPDLQKLYENYKDKGLVIVGVYSTFEQQEEAEAIVEEKGVTYPVIKCDENLKKYAESYVPTSFFTDGEGNVLNEELYSGARSYEDWEKIIQEYLN